eukprot:352058-Chlamydomonas_euryale.AAC.7
MQFVRSFVLKAISSRQRSGICCAPTRVNNYPPSRAARPFTRLLGTLKLGHGSFTDQYMEISRHILAEHFAFIILQTVLGTTTYCPRSPYNCMVAPHLRMSDLNFFEPLDRLTVVHNCFLRNLNGIGFSLEHMVPTADLHEHMVPTF